ncbi:putative receptor-type tyrosine-protein phosphatase F isoform X1 [Apostichopus japonicus]|uniref:Putative receptor-type tyrosine-protein phosphatase F isoform X1 n=1 Tax=Stichopus japonicus TaxID=307972 RepID=A0A2G8KV88_STIJA|nr:putative receptor-type tyrosine-protein phosphatase F isoform X1 [Apostichopus japonicus]
MPLTWQPPAMPNGAITRYDIQYWESATEGAEPTSIEFTDVNANQLRLMITDVEPLKEYTFRISATNEAGEGYWSNNFTQLIEEGAPSRVVDLTVTEIMEEAITIEWSEPLEPRGIISKYIVQYVVSDRPYYENEVAEKSITVLLEPDVTTFEITDLEPATEYSIKVLARTSKKEGESSMVKQFTLPPEDIPEPENVMIVSADVSEDGTIIVKLPPISYKYATAYQIGVHCKDVESEPTFFDGENSTDCSYIAGEVPNMEEDKNSSWVTERSTAITKISC